MATYFSPGVYVEEIPKFPPSVAQVETAIPAFIGYTQRADRAGVPITDPTRVTSLLEYERLFGQALPETVNVDLTEDVGGNLAATATVVPSRYQLYYHLQMYFANGGGPCYIVSVGLMTPGGTVDKAKLGAGLDALRRYDEPTLILFPDGTGLNKPEDLYGLYNLALAQCNDLKDRFVLMDCHGDDPARLRDASKGIGANNLKYGAAYHPFLKTTLPYLTDDGSVTILTHKKSQLKNDGTTEVVDGPLKGKKLSDVASQAAYPLIKLAIADQSVVLPPSPTIAGVYAATDSARGVWKAPANVSLTLVSGLTQTLTNTEQDGLNVDATGGKSINAIRAFTGRGILVWGARTLAGNDNEWRYVPVRRLFNMVEESVKKATAQFVFEPNDANTWVRLRAMIENYLINLWRQGALAGVKPEHAFYVNCGLGTTMTADDILNGNLVVEIGMAAVRPAEFIILRFSHKMQES
jgi:phage tail sheath protein FI